MLLPGLTMLRRMLLPALVGCVVFLTATTRAQTSQNQPQMARELDLPAYQAELARCAASIKRPEEISRLRRSLPPAWRVRTDETRIEVSTEWLTSALQKLERDPAESASRLRDIDVRLAAMRQAAMELETGSNETSPKDSRADLEKILRRREFRGMQGPSQMELLKTRILRWIAERIYRLFSRLHLGSTTGNVLAWIVVGLAFLTLCYWVWQSLSRSTHLPETPPDGPIDSTDSRMWAKDAVAAAERGDYREAVHSAYWAAVVHLEVLGLLKSDRARTPRESLCLLDPHPQEQKLLREFTRHFELIWYGYRPASADDWSDARTHLEKMGCLTSSTAATANS
jgi:Domain of unknown function (DUF4129)